MDRRMDRRTNQRTDRPSYRDARTHLKSVLKARAPRGVGFFCIVMLFYFMSYNHQNEWMSICLLISLSVSVFVSLSVTHTARDLGRSALFFFCGLSFLSSIFPRQINPHGGKMKLCEKMFRPNKVMLPKRDCAMFAWLTNCHLFPLSL